MSGGDIGDRDADRLRVHHVLTLAHLLSRGAGQNYVEITTAALGSGIRKSQQSASRHLADLERDGLVERGTAATTTTTTATAGRRMSVRVTKRGLEEMRRLSSVLQNSMSPEDPGAPTRVSLAGVLVSGMGEGAYYMALDGYTRQFSSKIGYVPFPGTLNIRLRHRRYQEAIKKIKSGRAGKTIESFSDGQRTYGWAKCFPAILRAVGDGRSKPVDGKAHLGGREGGGIPCQLIVLERTHHDDSIMELISEDCLRNAASISDGSEVVVDVLLDDE